MRSFLWLKRYRLLMKIIKKLQQRIDECIVQTEPGKREAVDYVEESKEKLHDFLEKLTHSGKESLKPVKAKIEELQVQLKLGRMESQDAYREQREKIEQLVGNIGPAMKDSKHHAAEEFHDLSSTLSDRMHLLALNAELAGEQAKDEAEILKTETKEKLSRMKKKLQENSEQAGEKAHEAAEETKEAFADIRSNLKSLFRKSG